jgi:hypothetical protein
MECFCGCQCESCEVREREERAAAIDAKIKTWSFNAEPLEVAREIHEMNLEPEIRSEWFDAIENQISVGAATMVRGAYDLVADGIL